MAETETQEHVDTEAEAASELLDQLNFDEEQQQAKETSTAASESAESEEKKTEDTAGDERTAAGEGEGAGGEDPVFPDHLLRRAGLTAAEAVDRGFSTPDALKDAVLYASEVMQANAPRPQQQGGKAADAAVQAGQPAGEEFVPLKLKVPDGFGEETRELLDSLESQFNERLKADHDARRSERQVADEQATANEKAGWWSDVDEAIVALDKSDVYGEGQFRSLSGKAKSYAEASRLRIAERVDADIYRYGKRGESVPPMSQLVADADRAEHGGEIENQATAKVSEQTRDARGQFTARPTQRKGKELTTYESAHARVSEAMRKKGIDPTDSDDVEEALSVLPE